MIKKGILLAGGTGSRLQPITSVLNKHLLLIYDKPMIYYGIQTLKSMKIQEVQIILGGENFETFVKILKDGSQFGLNFSYVYQREAGGIPQAILLSEDFVGDDKFIVYLGDNIFFNPIKNFADNFEKSDMICGLMLKRVPNPEIYGTLNFENGKIVGVNEKLQNPISDIAVTGLYGYSKEIFDVLKQLTPSARNELEISEAHDAIIKQKRDIYWELFDGEWIDCAASFDGLLDASLRIRELLKMKRIVDDLKNEQ